MRNLFELPPKPNEACKDLVNMKIIIYLKYLNNDGAPMAIHRQINP
jgi:hypothetical protein